MAKYKIAVIPLTTIESTAQPFDLNKFLGVDDICIIYFDYIKPVSSFYILYEEVKEYNDGGDKLNGFEEWAKQYQPAMPTPIPVWYDPTPEQQYTVGDFPQGPQPTCAGAIATEPNVSDIPEHLPDAERDLFDAAAVANELQRTIAEKYKSTGLGGGNRSLNG